MDEGAPGRSDRTFPVPVTPHPDPSAAGLPGCVEPGPGLDRYVIAQHVDLAALACALGVRRSPVRGIEFAADLDQAAFAAFDVDVSRADRAAAPHREGQHIPRHHADLAAAGVHAARVFNRRARVETGEVGFDHDGAVVVAELNGAARGHQETAVGGFHVAKIRHRAPQQVDPLAAQDARVGDPALEIIEAVLAREEIGLRQVSPRRHDTAHVGERAVAEVDARAVDENAGGVADHPTPELAGALARAEVQDREVLALAEFQAVMRGLLNIGLPIQDGLGAELGELGEQVGVGGELTAAVAGHHRAQGGGGSVGARRPGCAAEEKEQERRLCGQSLADTSARRDG